MYHMLHGTCNNAQAAFVLESCLKYNCRHSFDSAVEFEQTLVKSSLSRSISLIQRHAIT